MIQIKNYFLKIILLYTHIYLIGFFSYKNLTQIVCNELFNMFSEWTVGKFMYAIGALLHNSHLGFRMSAVL